MGPRLIIAVMLSLLTTGIGAKTSSASAADSVAQQELQVFHLKPNPETRIPLSFSRAYSFGPGDVIQPNKDIFSKYLLFFVINGKQGDRFKIDWSASVASDLDTAYDGGLDADYPAGATIYNKSSSATITLETTGEHLMVLSQIGMQYPSGSSGGLAGPSLSGGQSRPYQPTRVTVTRVN